LRRIVIAVTALIVLGAAAAAYADTAINTYTSPIKFTSTKAGTKKKPAPIGFSLKIAANGTNGNRTAILLDVKTKIYGVKSDGKDFPTCSVAKIAAAGPNGDKVCPKAAMVATGDITAALGSPSNFSATSAGIVPCAPFLHVWNGGQGKLVFFFVTNNTNHTCAFGAVTTGGTPPYPATVKMQGKYMVTNVPIPSSISFPSGFAGSLLTENLNFLKKTKKVHGKTVASMSSFACKNGKRPYSNTFTATLPPTHQTQTATVSGSAKCS
jgi:hypothetical protein